MINRMGILITGSLLWDENRKYWRKERLLENEKFLVKAPIRYGRKSSSRGFTYTMVLSQLCTNEKLLGTALVIKCKQQISCSNDLIKEAEELWAAESNSANSNNRISSNWGCVALLLNPNSNVPDSLINDWSKKVGQEINYGKFKFASGENSIVSTNGFLKIPWPQVVEIKSQMSIDMILSIANKPSLNGDQYPSVDDIVNAWKKSPLNYKYFLENRKNGISTFQDYLIEKEMSTI